MSCEMLMLKYQFLPNKINTTTTLLQTEYNSGKFAKKEKKINNMYKCIQWTNQKPLRLKVYNLLV